MAENKVELYENFENGKLGVGVNVLDPDATVADLLEAWEPLADDAYVVKQYADEFGLCKGCVKNCCDSAFVIPDVVSFKAMCRATGSTPQEFLDQYMEKDRTAAGVFRMVSPCKFLKDRICTTYPERSLICRFYICTSILGNTEELIYSVVTAGIAATYLWLESQGITGAAGHSLTSYDQSMLELVEKYKDHPAAAEFLNASGYGDVHLKNFVSI